jgi:hypothetical protein
MPHSKLHDKKKYKNYTLLSILVIMVVVFFTVTMIKLKVL